MDLSTRTYYDLLGISRTATTEEIKAVYKEIARVYHPDSNFYDEIIGDELDNGTNESDVFKAITAAYNTLVNEERRREYDQSLPPELPGWQSENEVHENSLNSRTNWDNDAIASDRYNARKRKPTGSFGREAVREFGVPGKSSFDDIEFGKNIEPVSALFRRPGLLARIKALFGR